MRYLFAFLMVILTLAVVPSIPFRSEICQSATTQISDDTVKNVADVEKKLGPVKNWCRGFKGLQIEEAKKLIGNQKPGESTWGDHEEHLKLEYDFGEFHLNLLCADDHVVVAMVFVSSADD